MSAGVHDELQLGTAMRTCSSAACSIATRPIWVSTTKAPRPSVGHSSRTTAGPLVTVGCFEMVLQHNCESLTDADADRGDPPPFASLDQPFGERPENPAT